MPVRPPVADTTADTAADSTARRRKVLTLEDTVKAPLASPYLPAGMWSSASRTEWNREELFAAGALTLGELIAQVPGTTMMTTGFLMAPQVLAWHGDPAGIRLFVDGVEREEVTPRAGGITDFALIPLWSLEQVTIETTAGELRVHARTWRVDRTTASTRTDVLTGSENLNLFRGYFGKRSSGGVAVQFAAQQSSTASVPGMDGDGLGAMARLGWAGGHWSIDATMLRQGLNRNPGVRFPLTAPLKDAFPAFHGSSSLSYLRAAWRDPQADGPWAQVVAATVGAIKTHAPGAPPADSADTTASTGQYSVSGGVNRGGLRLSGVARFRSAAGKAEAMPALRAEWGSEWLTLSANAGRRFGGRAVWDVRGAVVARPWLRFSASSGVSRAGSDTLVSPRSGSAVDASVRLRGRWVTVGATTLAAGVVVAPVGLDTVMRTVGAPDGRAITLSVSGPLAGGFSFRTEAIEWDAATTFRPQTQARTRIWFESAFPEKFPRANFHLLAALLHDYRGALYVPRGTDGIGQTAKAFSVFGTLLEIRI